MTVTDIALRRRFDASGVAFNNAVPYVTDQFGLLRANRPDGPDYCALSAQPESA
jgi:hypothetical protein